MLFYNRDVQPPMYRFRTSMRMAMELLVSYSQPAPQYPNWLCFWTITIQQLDGTQTSIKLPDINRTPIYKLRELVKEALSIPTHQQKLTLLGEGNNNTMVLEDWDEEGRAMAIAHYPSLHDGATLYLVQLTKGIHVKVVLVRQEQRVVKRVDTTKSRLPSTIPLSSISLPSYVNIHLPHKFSLNCLTKICSTRVTITPLVHPW